MTTKDLVEQYGVTIKECGDALNPSIRSLDLPQKSGKNNGAEPWSSRG